MNPCTREEALAAAGAALAVAIERRAALTPREAAERAHRPGGPAVDELETRIRARRKLAASPTDTSEPTG